MYNKENMNFVTPNMNFMQKMTAFYMHSSPQQLPPFPSVSDETDQIGKTLDTMFKKGILTKMYLDKHDTVHVA